MEESDLVFYKDFVNADEIQFEDITKMSLKQLVIYQKNLLTLGKPNILTKKQKEKKKEFLIFLDQEYDEPKDSCNYELADLHKKKRNWEWDSFHKECQKQNQLFLEKSKNLLLEIQKLVEQLKDQSTKKHIEDRKIFNNEKFKCKCGMMTIRKNIARHKKCQAHVAYEARIEEEAEANRKKKGLKNLQVKNKLEDDGLPVYPKDEKGFTIMPKSKEMEDFYATFLT
jgi:hypothetical protein